jgi:hypothetical protein
MQTSGGNLATTSLHVNIQQSNEPRIVWNGAQSNLLQITVTADIFISPGQKTRFNVQLLNSNTTSAKGFTKPPNYAS